MAMTKARKKVIEEINANRNIERKGAEGTQKTNSANAGTKPLGVICRCGCKQHITQADINADNIIFCHWLSKYANGIWLIKSHLWDFKQDDAKSMSNSKTSNIKLRFRVAKNNYKLLSYVATTNDYNADIHGTGAFVNITSRVFTNRSGVNKHASGFVAYNSDMQVSILDENDNLITTAKAGDLATTLKKIK